MKDRLNNFLKERNITATRFAEEIGVQRSSISHILSGRNNPGYDFIVKVLKKYPEIRAEWLLLGEGNMIKGQNSPRLFENIEKSGENEVKTGERAGNKEDENEVTNVNNGMIDSNSPTSGDKVEKIIILNADQTFKEYKPA